MTYKDLTKTQQTLYDLCNDLEKMSDYCQRLDLLFLKLENKCRDYVHKNDQEIEDFYESEEYIDLENDIVENLKQMRELSPFDFSGASERTWGRLAKALGFKDGHITLRENKTH